MRPILDNKKADAELNAAVYRVIHRDLPTDPAARQAEMDRRAAEVNASTLAVLAELGQGQTDTLEFFGRNNEELEKQVIAWVINHAAQPWMQKLIPHIEPKLFNSYHGMRLCKIIHESQAKAGVIPSRGMIRQTLGQVLTADEADMHDELIDWLDTKPDPAIYDYMVGPGDAGLMAQFKKRAYSKVLEGEEIALLLEAGEYEQIDTIFPKCFPEPDRADVLSLKADLEQFLAEDNVQSIGIGFPTLDGVMHEKGAARGEVLVWLANTGVGKTTLMLNCSAHAVRKGLNVAYVVLEGTAKSVGQRLTSVMANCPTRTLHDHPQMVERAIAGLPASGDVRLIQPSDEVWTTRHIAKKLDYLRATEGFVPDVVMIDYAKFLKPANVAKQDAEYVKLAKTMDDVKRLAMDLDCLVITAQQANREGEDAATIGLKHAAGSYDALQPVDYVVSVNQTTAEELKNTMRLTINKNRHGREQVTAYCNINRASGLTQEG